MGTSRPALQVHVLAFEGPDPYARAGGLATRVQGLTQALAARGHDAHLWFVGSPTAAGQEPMAGVLVHRWCQWISAYHPGGVYDGEEGKVADYGRSLPPFLFQHWLLPHLRDGGRAAILAEDWHTAGALLHLDQLLRQQGVRDRVALVWTANNLFGRERVPWEQLRANVRIATVSRAMRQRLCRFGVDAVAIPNGLSPAAFTPVDATVVRALRARLAGRYVLVKVARFDPDKRWSAAVRLLERWPESGPRPLLIARAGIEAHGHEVRAHAQRLGLHWQLREACPPGAGGVRAALRGVGDADVIEITTPLTDEACRYLYAVADLVLANSAFEPFGLVGLEAMAVGAIVCVGGTGEDYARPPEDSICAQTDDPAEVIAQLAALHAEPGAERSMRSAALRTARAFTWERIVARSWEPRLWEWSGGTVASPVLVPGSLPLPARNRIVADISSSFGHGRMSRDPPFRSRSPS
jgi:glycosyltransferase involved in cell wall biosynthesis